MATKYCSGCPKSKDCPIKNKMGECGIGRAGFYGIGGEGLLPEYSHPYSLDEIESMKDCPYVHLSIENAIANALQNKDISDAVDFSFSSFGSHVYCHVFTNSDYKKIQDEKKKAGDDFQKRVSQKLDGEKERTPTSSWEEFSIRYDREQIEKGLSTTVDLKLDNVMDFLFEVEGKIKEGAIAYSKAVEIAFDTETPDKIAQQFSCTLANAKGCAARAGQPITVFAKFMVNAKGELYFDCPIQYSPKAKVSQLQNRLKADFKVKYYKGTYIWNLSKEKALEALEKLESNDVSDFRFY